MREEGQERSLPFRITASDGIPIHSFQDGSSPVLDRGLVTTFLKELNELLGMNVGHLMELPANYCLRQLSSGTLVLYGHPSGHPFMFPDHFLPHLRWLMEGRLSQCACVPCRTPQNVPLPPISNGFAFLVSGALPSKDSNIAPLKPSLTQFVNGEGAVESLVEDKIDYHKRHEQLTNYIKETKIMNEKMERILVRANEKISKLKFENKFLVETLHEKNDALFEPNPYSSSKRIYEIDDAIQVSEMDVQVNGGGYGQKDQTAWDLVHGSEKKRSPRRKRQRLFDPNAPKRPVNAFMVFSEMQRDAMKQERADLAKNMPQSEDLAVLKNLSKAAAARWKVLPDEEKQIYKDIYKSQIEQFEKDMEEYRQRHPDSIASVIARNRQLTGVRRPISKPPLAEHHPSELSEKYVVPFQVFYEEHSEALRESNKEKPLTEVDVKLKLLERWNSMAPEEKRAFEIKASELNQKNNITVDRVKEQDDDDGDEEEGHQKEGDLEAEVDENEDELSSSVHQDEIPLEI